VSKPDPPPEGAPNADKYRLLPEMALLLVDSTGFAMVTSEKHNKTRTTTRTTTKCITVEENSRPIPKKSRRTTYEL
jgi:hypothetical protein